MGIFGKTETKPQAKQVQAPRPSTPAAAKASSKAPTPSSSQCIIGAKTVVKGDISGDEDILVEGTVEGTIKISRDLKVGPIGEAPVKKHASEFIIGLYAPTTKPGTYDVYISVGKSDGTPTIAMPLKNGDGQRRYKIGTIELLEK